MVEPKAAVVWVSDRASTPIVGIPLVERLIVALHRSGVERFSLVGDGRVPEFRRLARLGIRVDASAPSPPAEEHVFADGALFVSKADVERVIAARGRLAGEDGKPLPLEVRRGGAVPPPAVRAERPAFVVEDDADRRRATRALWASLGSRADGVVDRWLNRPIGRVLSKILVHTPITPNLVTVLGTLVGLAAASLIAEPDPVVALAGTLLFQLAAAIDCVDGELARVRFQESAFGQWLDLGLDQVVHVAIFAGVALHCARRGLDLPATWLGLSAVAGTLLSFAVVVRGLLRRRRGGRAPASGWIDRMATRDFSVAMIAFAAFDQLGAFLWLTGTLTHLFWIAALVADRPARGAVPLADGVAP